MRDAANIHAVARHQPDYLGFIEYPRSPRFVGADFVVPTGLSTDIVKTGVFVDERLPDMLQRARDAGYDAIQLHGAESPAFCADVRQAGLRVIKVFRVDSDFDFSATGPFVDVADVFLFDARGLHPGGNGIRFDWRVLTKYDQKVPFFLSGGLGPTSLAVDIGNLNGMNLYGVDLNSGVESAPGMKDIDKVEASIQTVRSMQE